MGRNTPLRVLPSSVASRKTQGTAGQFDLELPLSADPAIRTPSRGADGEYTFVFPFPELMGSGGRVGATATGEVQP